jgi:hypothetical protein
MYCVHASALTSAREHRSASTQPLTLPFDCAVVPCQNSPLLAQAGLERATSLTKMHGECTQSGPTFQPPDMKALDDGTAVEWSRLLSFGLKPVELETILHRSHHAMSWLGFANVSRSATLDPSDDINTFLLWGGFDTFMALNNDMWLIHVHSANACRHELQGHVDDHAVRCWTAHMVKQHGTVPSGRAYAKLGIMQVSS